MADYQQKIELLIGGNSTEAVEALQKAQDKAKQVANDVPAKMGKSGKDAGEKFGRELFTSQKKWLDASASLLNQYGGRVGRILGGLLSQYGRLRDAQLTSQRLSERMAAEAGGSALGKGVATAAGSAAGSFFGAKKGAAGGAYKATAEIIRELQPLMSLPEPPKRKQLPPGFRADDQGLMFDRRLINEPQQVISKQAPPVIANATRFSGVLATLGKVAGSVGLVLGGTLAVAIGAVAATFAIGAIRAKQFRKEVESYKTKILVEEINSIGDSVERTAAILQALGKDGQAKFIEMEKEVEKLNRKLKDSSGWRQFSTLASLAAGTMKDQLKSYGVTLLNIFTFLPKKIGNAILNVSAKIWGINKDLVNNLVEGEARVAMLQAKLDQKRIERAEREKGLTEQIANEKEKLANELLSDESKLHIVSLQIQKLNEAKVKSKEQELILARLLTEQLQLQKTIEEQKRAGFTKTPEQRANEFMKDVDILKNPLARENNPTILGNEARARAIQEDRAKRAASISLSQELNRINYQRQSVGLPALTEMQRRDIATDRLVNQKAAQEGKDPMQILADSFLEHGALIVKPVYSK
jgi:hypothetical protein